MATLAPLGQQLRPQSQHYRQAMPVVTMGQHLRLRMCKLAVAMARRQWQQRRQPRDGEGDHRAWS